MRSSWAFPESTLKYYPVRFAQARPFLPIVLRTYRQHLGTGLFLSMSGLGAMMRLYGEIYDGLVGPLPAERRPLDIGCLGKEMDAGLHYCAFVQQGRNIFHLLPEVATMLRHTDVDAIPLEAVKVPYPVLYLWFGPQAALDPWGTGDVVDGAYVTRREAKGDVVWEIILSTWRADVDYRRPRNVILRPDRYYYCPLEPAGPDATVGEAVEKQLLKETSFCREDLPDTSGVYELDGRRVQIVDLRGEAQEREVREFATGYPVFREALKLVMNGVCFITAYPDDIEARRPEETPPELLEQAETGRTARLRKEAAHKLDYHGYVPIRFCGGAAERTAGFPTGREVSPHWRRGHWRHQPHGVGRALRKLVWIMPVVVRKDRGEPTGGHVYLVDQPEAPKDGEQT